MNKILITTRVVVILSLFVFACTDQSSRSSNKILRLGTTTSTVGSGLAETLLNAFEEAYDVQVQLFSVGSGQTLELARQGKVDVVLVHSRADEDAFVREGYGLNRVDVMYNDFVLLGPKSDPAKLRGDGDIMDSLAKIAAGRFDFVSRGDQSGTHKREMDFWNTLSIQPEGDWYCESRTGMTETLMKASDRGAYVLTDRSTYRNHSEEVSLEILVQGDRRMRNIYDVIAVNPTCVQEIAYNNDMDFIAFVTSESGQKIIAEYGVEQFGEQLYIPVAFPRSGLQ